MLKDNIMSIIQGYKGSRHAPTSKVASNVKVRGHKKEEVFAQRLGNINYVVKGTQKPDVIKEDNRYSIKGATTNIQLFLSRLNKSKVIYGAESPIYQFQLAGYNHRKFKFENDDMVDTNLFNTFKSCAETAAEWLRNKNNFRFVIEKVFSDNYDANKLVVLKEIDQDALVYDMKDVVDLYVNSEYNVHVTDGAKIVVRVDDREIFYLEIRGGKDHCGSMNHGVRKELYNFLEENLTPEVIPA
jgi:hypothetical protein